VIYSSNTSAADSRSKASTLVSSKAMSTSSEVLVAKKKILIKKNFKNDQEGKLINLNQVSAMCPVLNLRKNLQSGIYLKAN
jgi:hypothetical protein